MISSIFYNGDGSTRIFPVTFKINGEDYVRVYVDNVEVVDRTKYDIINNSIVFTSDDIPAVGTDNIKIYVATSASELGDLGAPLTDITNVANNLAEIVAVSTQVIPNLPEILLADNNATIATTQANLAIAAMNAAEVSEDNAAASAVTATSQASIATTKANEASASAGSASASATTATTQAGIATTKAGEASTSASNASTSAVLAQGYADSINPSTLVHKTGDTMTGNLVFASGTKITGDFSNATLSSRTVFQTSAVNSDTSVSLIPNGTATISQLVAYTSSDINNSSSFAIQAVSTDVRLASRKDGTGAYLPITAYTSGIERLRIDTSGNVLVTGSGGLGYGTGSGGTVTQLTSKSTSVTLNKPCGQIIMNNASLASNTTVSFLLLNSLASINDTLQISQVTGTGSSGAYMFSAVASNGGFLISVRNISGGALSEALGLNFAIIKGAIA